MALQPVNRRSVPEDVFEQILAEVLSGEMTPGQSLPSERRLVEVRQGDGTTVRDFRRHAGLDLLPRLLLRGDELDLAVVRSILEARLHNGPKVAELAAARRPDDLLARLEQSISDLQADADPVGQQRHALGFWDHIVDGADSIVFRLMFNTLRAAYEPALPALAVMMSAEVGNIAAYRTLARAVEDGDPPAAEAAARRLLEPATHTLITALDAMEESR
jgi:DNA-binding FadR family transcriptional regulator